MQIIPTKMLLISHRPVFCAIAISSTSAFLTTPHRTFHPHLFVDNGSRGYTPSPFVLSASLSNVNTEGSEEEKTNLSSEIPSCIVSPVLTQVYPALIAHKAKHGNPNIPLGNIDGKRCKTLRRLHFQNKLTPEEVTLLTDMGFRFHSFEDVYYECDFDEMLGKLLDYHRENQTYQIPKKYVPDPELGAWVTMLRRLYRTNDLPEEQVEKMDDVGFEWVSTRKCGSSFMSRYREVLSQLNEIVDSGEDANELVSKDDELKKWIAAQRLAFENGNLSDSRVQYMDDLPGIDWREEI